MNIPQLKETRPSKVTHEQIAALAYDLWERSGRLANHDMAFWLEAEGELNKTEAKSRNHVRGNNRARSNSLFLGKG